MPPPISTSLLKSITVPSHLHPPFIYGNTKPSHTLQGPRILTQMTGITIKNCTARNSITGRKGRGTAVLAGDGRWMGFGSGRAPFTPAGEGSMGARKWAGGSGRVGGDATHNHVMGSLLNEEGEVEINGGYNMQQLNSPRLLTLPTVLTLGRVAAVPILVSTYHMNGWWATTATTSIFLAAAFTDWLDGYIARKMQLGTAFGAFLDPVADKLMVAATLVLLCTKPLEVAIYGEVPWLLTVPSIAIIGREITMSAVREWAASQNSRILEAVAVNSLGKWKTATQMTALTILLATRDPSLAGSGAIVASGVFLLYISAGLALWSLVVYVRNIWRILLK